MNNPADVVDQMLADTSINGQHVDVDKAFGGQCWDLVELFAERCGVPKEPWAITLGPEGVAHEAWTVFDAHLQTYFDKVPAGQQQKGDIGVYAGRPGFEAGHILIFLNNDNQVFEENADPDGAPAHIFSGRLNTYLLGSLRLKGGEMSASLNDVRIVNAYICGNNGLGGKPNALAGEMDSQLTGWVGKDVQQMLESFYNSDEAKNYREKLLPSVYGDGNTLAPGKYIVR